MCTFPKTFRTHYDSYFPRQDNGAMPKPGEIWMIRRDIPDLVPFSLLEQNRFSEPARHFIEGGGPSRYVMIVGDMRLLSEYSEVLDLTVSTSTAKTDLHNKNRDDYASELIDQIDQYIGHDIDQYWVSVMVLGNAQKGISWDKAHANEKLQQISEADVFIPAHLSKLDHHVIAETWHIVPMLVKQLFRPIGHRVSPTLYNHLMDIGDAAFSQTSARSNSSLASNPIHFFHQIEQQWSEVLRFPITACRMQLELLAKTTPIMVRAIELERGSLNQ